MSRRRYRSWSIRIILLLIVLFNMDNAFSQDENRQKVTEEKVLVAALDQMHQIYYINGQRQLYKLVPAQNRNYLYTDLFVDRQTILFVQNALKILLYKKDIGALVTLDSRLNMTGKINLFDLGYYDVTTLATANDNQSIWLFDKASQQLVRLDQQYKQTFISPVMPQQIGFDLNPVYITETEGKVYLVDYEKGVFIFDNFGNFFRQIPLSGLRKIWIFGSRILYYQDDQIWQYDLLMMEKAVLAHLPGYKDIYLSKEFILGLNSEGDLFTIPWPKKP
jgi:hypothetical protein